MGVVCLILTWVSDPLINIHWWGIQARLHWDCCNTREQNHTESPAPSPGKAAGSSSGLRKNGGAGLLAVLCAGSALLPGILCLLIHTHTVILASYSFFLFCCSRRHVFRFECSSEESQLPAPSLPPVQTSSPCEHKSTGALLLPLPSGQHRAPILTWKGVVMALGYHAPDRRLSIPVISECSVWIFLWAALGRLDKASALGTICFSNRHLINYWKGLTSWLSSSGNHT